MGWLWILVTVGGPILLAAALAYVSISNRRQTKPGDEERSDLAAKRLREELNREDEQRERTHGHV